MFLAKADDDAYVSLSRLASMLQGLSPRHCNRASSTTLATTVVSGRAIRRDQTVAIRHTKHGLLTGQNIHGSTGSVIARLQRAVLRASGPSAPST